jgi:hypothetical protein
MQERAAQKEENRRRHVSCRRSVAFVRLPREAITAWPSACYALCVYGQYSLLAKYLLLCDF